VSCIVPDTTVRASSAVPSTASARIELTMTDLWSRSLVSRQELSGKEAEADLHAKQAKGRVLWGGEAGLKVMCLPM